MTEQAIDDLVAILPPLLESLEALGFLARHLHPPDFEAVLKAVGHPDSTLREASAGLRPWPDNLADVRSSIDGAVSEALAGYAALRDVAEQGQDLRAVFRALRHLPRAQEALFTLAGRLQPVSSYFLEPDRRDDATLLERSTQPVRESETGVLHGGGEPGSRGAYSIYVPEYYSPERAWPLVMALHGGSGNGRAFLWSWVREARSRGAIVVAPTARGATWALMGEDIDTPNLVAILDHMKSRWNIDTSRMLLTGMSDGGTFSYVSGLEPSSPFTHLAPVAAAFHPMLAQMADRERLRGLPIRAVHGKLDWMFPVEMAQHALKSLSAAGADISLREIDDLSHCYPREINSDLLEWLAGTGRSQSV